MSIEDDETMLDGAASEKTRHGLLKAGDRLGDYVLMRLLGAGAMGQVYLAKQIHLNQTCAIKVLPEELSRSKDFTKRFESEGQALARVDHHFVVRVLNASVYEGRYFMVLEYVDGGDLAEYLHKKGGKLGEQEARVVLEQVLEGLAFAHKKGIVHRDLKPANILRSADGEFKISDFGLALVMDNEVVQDMIRKSVVAAPKETDPDATLVDGVDNVTAGRVPTGDETLVAGTGSTSSSPEDETLVDHGARADKNTIPPHGSYAGSASAFVGTLDYMSPEVRAGQSADARSDIYAIGIIAYQMLTGRKPLGRAKAVSVLSPDIAPEWDAWVDKCLEVEPAERFASASDALEALGSIPKRDAAPKDTPATTGSKPAMQAAAGPSPVVQSPFPVRKQDSTAPREKPKPTDNSTLVVSALIGAVIILLCLSLGAYYFLNRKPLNAVQAPAPAIQVEKPENKPAEPVRQISPVQASNLLLPQVAAKGKIALKGDYSALTMSLDGAEAIPAVPVINDLETGEHLLRFERAGYDPHELTVNVGAGNIAQVKVPALKRQMGGLSIEGKPVPLSWKILSAPEDAKLEKNSGTTPATLGDLPTGDYEIEFSLDGFKSQKLAANVEKGKTAQALVAIAGGSVTIKCNVPGAIVRDASGNDLGKTPFDFAFVPVGDYSFNVSLDGYGAATVRGHLPDGGKLELFATLEKFSRPEPGRAAGLIFPNGVIMPIEWIRPGDFQMGSESDELGREKSERAHNVHISNGFWMGRYEVTQAQWKAVMGNNPSGFANAGPDAPVERVSWDEATDFCRKLTEMAKKANVLPDGYIYALPTEAEWEYACRAGSMGAYSGSISDMGWTADNSRRTTHAAGQKIPNAFGLCDIYGNVAEWCADWYGEYNSADSVDPKGPSSGRFRVVRGGSWQQSRGKCRSASRNSFLPTDRWPYIGLRVVLVKGR